MVQKYAKKSSYAVSWIIHSLVVKITAKPLILNLDTLRVGRHGLSLYFS